MHSTVCVSRGSIGSRDAGQWKEVPHLAGFFRHDPPWMCNFSNFSEQPTLPEAQHMLFRDFQWSTLFHVRLFQGGLAQVVLMEIMSVGDSPGPPKRWTFQFFTSILQLASQKSIETRNCRCRRLLDVVVHHHAACGRLGVRGQRGVTGDAHLSEVSIHTRTSTNQ